jgi:hypothetical protein
MTSAPLPTQALLFDVFGDYNKQPPLNGRISLVTSEPYRIGKPRQFSEYRIFYTLFESNRLPNRWVEILNDQASEVRPSCSF